MIWKKHGERLIGEKVVLIITDSRNKEDEFLLNQLAKYEKNGYKVNIKYFEGR